MVAHLLCRLAVGLSTRWIEGDVMRTVKTKIVTLNWVIQGFWIYQSWKFSYARLRCIALRQLSDQKENSSSRKTALCKAVVRLRGRTNSSGKVCSFCSCLDAASFLSVVCSFFVHFQRVLFWFSCERQNKSIYKRLPFFFENRNTSSLKVSRVPHENADAEWKKSCSSFWLDMYSWLVKVDSF